MTERVTFTLPGTPKAKGRPKFYRGRAITDAKTKAAERAILLTWIATHGDRAPHDGAVEVEFVATFAAAESWPKWKRMLAALGKWPHLSKPDLDNLVKLLDGLNGRAWVDDSQITHIRASKHYGDTASTAVTLTFHPAPTKSTTEKGASRD